MTKAQEVDPLDYKPSAAEASGEKVLVAEGNKGTCMIEIEKFWAIDPDNDPYGKLKKGVTGRFQIKLSNPKLDQDMVAFLNHKPGGLTEHYPLWKLMFAVFGKDMDKHSVRDLNGEKVSVYVSHETANGKKFVDWKFTPAT